MMSRSGFLGNALALGALAAVCLAVGCAKPSAPPEQFVGTWIAAPPGAKLKPGAYPTLTLAPDGTGVYTEYPDPHSQNVSWVLRGDKFVMADRGGSGSMTYSYRFKGRDELLIVMERGELAFQRYAEAETKDTAAPGAQQKAGAASTRGESARPPARSHR